jgi:hypothetical protein
MNFTKITLAAGKAALKFKKNSPTLMFVVGLGSVGASVVLASRATLRLDEVLGKDLDVLEDIKIVEGAEKFQYDHEDATKDKIVVYGHMVLGVARLYAPAIIVGGVGVACLTGSHNILMKRNAALMAAYAGLERSYNLYRAKVREEIGEDRERALHYEVATDLAKEAQTRPLNSKGGAKFPGYSEYAKFFDEASSSWERNPEKNLFFISCQQRWCNDLLHRRGFLFLNEVYTCLGLPMTTAGAVVGWTMFQDGDNYVDFGIFDHHTNEVRNFVNGVENNILLDFNVEGVIYDKIER